MSGPRLKVSYILLAITTTHSLPSTDPLITERRATHYRAPSHSLPSADPLITERRPTHYRAPSHSLPSADPLITHYSIVSLDSCRFYYHFSNPYTGRVHSVQMASS